jgi:hypothetical protein
MAYSSVSPGESAAPGSAVSWGAIIAGAVAASALSLILLILGTGLGLSSVSPWANRGAEATTIGVSTVIWLTFTQLAASGMGGYLAGRLRTKWASVHTDEVYFRDTAHGFLAWAVASLVTAALLTSAVGSILGNGIQAGASVASGAASAAATGTAAAAGSGAADSGSSSSGPAAYFVDSLFRKDMSAATPTSTDTANSNQSGNASTPAPAAEITRIFMNSIRTGNLPTQDVTYVGQVVAQRTGLSQQDAEKRVTTAYSTMQTKLRDAETAARDTADKARKTSAYAALWMFITLLIGAFVASLAATYGGRRRDL